MRTNSPSVRIYQGHEPDMDRADVCVVIDVLRAFTTAQVAFSNGAKEIYLVGDISKAFALAGRHTRAGARRRTRLD